MTVANKTCRPVFRKECLACAVANGRGAIVEIALSPSAALALVQLQDFYPLGTTMESAIVSDVLERRLRQVRRRRRAPTTATGDSS